MTLETIAIVTAALLIGILIGRIPGSRPSGAQANRRVRVSNSLPPDFEARVKEMIGKGQKILALHEMRQTAGLGIHEGKGIVNAMERGIPLAELIEYGSPLPDQYSGAQVDQMKEVEKLIKSGKKIEALKLYREANGVGLKEAKDVIDRMARELR